MCAIHHGSACTTFVMWAELGHNLLGENMKWVELGISVFPHAS